MKLHTPAEVAEMFGGDTTERKVRDWARQYGWPHLKIGRSVRFTDEHLAEILARHTVTRQADAPRVSDVVIDGQTERSAAYWRRHATGRQP